MESPINSTYNFIRGPRRFSASLFIILLLSATLLLACNPFNGDDEEALPGDEPTEETSPELAEVGLERILTEVDQLEQADKETAAAEPEPSPTPTEIPAAAIPVPTVTTPGNDDQARNLVWAYLTQCVSIKVNDLEARQIQGEWFVQAAGEPSDQYGLWKVDPSSGVIQAHNIRARQWEPLINQDCTPGLFSGFFTPTPSPLLNSDITEASQAVTTLWATLVNCYPNMAIDDLQATLNSAKGEWVVTAKTNISANYGVWAVASDGTVSPKNRQAQGVFDQLDSGLC
ncbi:MAG: hypothetical protein O2909_01565 [Chloroflexi bacterium]|nr:hypothetical protein [Chloroflexota bacterium]MDA1218118.1 hypothetical protein [Chloroflexota bacterium]PKB57885.1 MAG: hypothetical protein BZY73_00595 [SAR202 cluster bacterium Casp-Chloro-G3]